MTNMIAVVTSRGSHVHHTPHVGFAQIDPATRKRPVKSTPISADATATASKKGRFVQSQPTDARKTITKARYASHARMRGNVFPRGMVVSVTRLPLERW